MTMLDYLVALAPWTVHAFGMLLVVALLFATMWAGHTDRSRAQMVILRKVIQAYGWQEKEFAHVVKLSIPQLSRMFAGESLNLHRLNEYLPDDFHAMWDAARVTARGGRVYEKDELTFIRGLAAMPKPEMARMTLSTRKEA